MTPSVLSETRRLESARRMLGTAYALFAVLAAACSSPDGTAVDEHLEQAQAQLTAAQERVLGFEAPADDWASSQGVSSSSTSSQGSASLAVTPNGYAEVVSVPLASLGPVKSQISFDLLIPQSLSWGEARLILSIPSQGMYWQDLGAVALAGLPVGTFNTLSYALPATVEAALESSYTDLTLRVVLNASTTSSPFLLDHFDVAEGGGGTPTPSAVNLLTFTYPAGHALSTVFMSASDRLQLDDRVTLAQAGQAPVLAGLGTSGVELGASALVYGNVFSGADVLLRSASHVHGSVSAVGLVTSQAGALVDGATTQNSSVPTVLTTVAVSFPPADSGQIIGPDGPLVALAPGSYASLDVRSRGRVSLEAGSYYFDTFNSEPEGEIQLAGSPIYLYVKSSFTYRGGFERVAGEDGQVLVGYLGTSTAVLQAPFVGTIAAPNATVELHRPDGAQHRGAFFGKKIQAFSDSNIGFVPFDSALVCPEGCFCPPGYSGPNCEDFCASSRDSDQDGILDCDDPCPLHADKAEPGKCGCAVADTDTDEDGTPDCRDPCPLDPAHIAPAECGCVGDATLKPAGTSCSNAFCPGQTETTCSATGVCGDPDACKPEPICFPLETSASNYFICTNRSWADAASSCAAKGMRLARVDTFAENERLRGLMPFPAWIGGNALTGAGVWRWADDPSGAGEQFWAGDDQGSVVDNRFAFWAAGAPGGNRCVMLDPASGHWRDRGCDAALPYVCEYTPPARVGAAPALALASQPDPLICPPPVSNIPPEPECFGSEDEACLAELEAQGEAAAHPTQPNYYGSAVNPPDRGTKPCAADPKSSACPLTDIVPGVLCTTDESCSQFGGDYVCRIVLDDPLCDDVNGTCSGKPRCGKVDCPCPLSVAARAG